MKKFFLFCFVAAVAATVVSCSKKDDDGGVSVTKGNLVGRWEMYKEADYYPGDGWEYDEEWGAKYGNRLIWEFRSDGTGSDIYMALADDGIWDPDELDFTYSLSGKTLRIKYYYDDESEVYTIEKLTSNELVLVYNYEDGDIEKSYFKRI